MLVMFLYDFIVGDKFVAPLQTELPWNEVEAVVVFVALLAINSHV